MRRVILFSIVIGLFGTAAAAETAKNCADVWWAKNGTYRAKKDFPHYMTMCLAEDFRLPASWVVSSPPSGATGKCKDGVWTSAPTAQDACSMNGGLDIWLPRR